MSDFVIGQIRTYVPIIVGAFLTWLGTFQLDLWDIESELIVVVAGALSAIYYFIVRLAAQKWPGIGVLLGYNVKPKYNDASSETSYNALGR